MHLGFIPRLKIVHTSASAFGQIYIPVINWVLMGMVILLVLTFRTSSNLASAYGIAVTGAMLIDTCLLAVVLFRLWAWNRIAAVAVLAVLFLVDGAYFTANLTKVPDGGWFPLLIGGIAFTLLTTWGTGRRLVAERTRAPDDIETFITKVAPACGRVPGTAVFLSAAAEGVPHALRYNIRHNKVLHEQNVIVTVQFERVPFVDAAAHADIVDLGAGFSRIVLRYGFMQKADVPESLSRAEHRGKGLDLDDVSFFLGRQTIVPTALPGMALWRERLFALMVRSAETPMEFLKLPTGRGHRAGQPGRDLTAARTAPAPSASAPDKDLHMADDSPILPAHIEQTVQAIAQLHADHEASATPLQRLVERVTARAGRPRFLALLTVLIVVVDGPELRHGRESVASRSTNLPSSGCRALSRSPRCT